MEVIFGYLLNAVNALLALFGKQPIEVDDGGFMENVKAMIEGLMGFTPETPDANI